MELLNTNTIKIIGKLVDAKVTTGNRKDNGQGYISVDATVVSVINGVENEYKIGFYSNQTTKDGKMNKLYESYSKMPELVGRKVEIDGEIRENRYFSSNSGQLVSTQLLSGKFIKGVVESKADVATFKIGGFLVKTLVERQNKKGEVYRYDLAIGQANYNASSMNIITLHVNPTDRNIISGIENTYQLGDTVQFDGDLVFKVETVTVEDENTAFGAPVLKTYTNRQSNFYITSGSHPLTDDRAYPSDVIATLNASYKAHDVELQSKGVANSTDTSSTNSTVTAPVTKRQTSLI